MADLPRVMVAGATPAAWPTLTRLQDERGPFLAVTADWPVIAWSLGRPLDLVLPVEKWGTAEAALSAAADAGCGRAVLFGEAARLRAACERRGMAAWCPDRMREAQAA